ncbi:hypothetical protein A9973_24450 [Achromobacter sp. UMC46]|nr:hypothetical protein [Achromobacter sp. UMC46]
MAQQTIGCVSRPDASALLQLGCPTTPTDKGLLNAKVQLSSDDVFGLAGNTMTPGMTVYNTATTEGPNGVRPGLYTWDGTRWLSNTAGEYVWVNSTATGNSTAANSGAKGANSVAVGGNALATGSSAIAIGPQSAALGDESVAMGMNAAANASGGVAIGSGATVQQAGGVAIGAGSVSNTAAGVAGYVPTGATSAQTASIQATTSTQAAVSVGNAASGQYRQISGVAAGTADSDAVNVSQLKAVGGDSRQYTDEQVDKVGGESRQYTDHQISAVRGDLSQLKGGAYSGVAAATALTMIPDVDLGRTVSVGFGTAYYKGYQALAIGGTVRLMQNLKARAGAGISSGNTTFGVGASYQW